ncbi:hypothetical protein BP00DRAFT_108629 [Aspergillus indologenus CBS 114.80]|uniref:Uncharacterized protein n=1 Tax=Aspergillus indologenus CBS 114.80 TaxID=1450541 RepID=A0A2V5IIK4_9EURO|nr:hypothetical protein BP00DRAFT_108629 [Aspergillus indologenus CBS 114.80]
MGVLLRRDCRETYNGYVCDGNSWYDWGRWIAFAVIVGVALLVFFLFAYVLPFLPVQEQVRRLIMLAVASMLAVGADKAFVPIPAPHGSRALRRHFSNRSNSNSLDNRTTQTLTTSLPRRRNTPLILSMATSGASSKRALNCKHHRTPTTMAANVYINHRRALLRPPRSNHTCLCFSTNEMKHYVYSQGVS